MFKPDFAFILKLLLPVGMTFGSLTVHAMGLGSIDVQSGLGEPLRATIQLIDTPKQLDTSCFRLQRGNDDLPATPLNASLSLRESPDGKASLSIRSYQAMNDPIVQLNLIAVCENQINREYVLLLDPPQTQTSSSPSSENDFANPTIIPVATSAITEESGTPEFKAIARSTSVNEPKPVKTEIPAKKPVTRHRNQGLAAPATAAVTKLTESDAPRLVISGADPLHTDFFNSPLQLQMSMELNDWPTTDMPTLSANDVSDEMTAMANKLAFLESQMIALQKRNAELESLRTTDSAAADGGPWLMYTLLTLLVIALIGVAEWLRRRHSQQQIATELAIWDELAPEVEHNIFDAVGETAVLGADHVNPTTSSEAANRNKPDFMNHQPSIQTPDYGHAGTTVNEDILEQAEVFVAHGRANLAIVLLQDHLSDFPDLSPEPWLMMLDLLKRDGQASAYEAATVECKRHFNVAIAGYDEPLQEDDSSIENYPHVAEQLQKVWGTAEALPFLDDLIFNRRMEARQGFDRNAYLEILLLRSMLGDSSFAISEKPLTAKGVITLINTPPETQNVMEATVLEEVSPLLNPTAEEHLFADELTSRRLTEDKSKPLEFEFPIRS
jgi:hypothetical protein